MVAREDTLEQSPLLTVIRRQKDPVASPGDVFPNIFWLMGRLEDGICFRNRLFDSRHYFIYCFAIYIIILISFFLHRILINWLPNRPFKVTSRLTALYPCKDDKIVVFSLQPSSHLAHLPPPDCPPAYLPACYLPACLLIRAAARLLDHNRRWRSRIWTPLINHLLLTSAPYD
jgi:hypothetical protein